MLIRTASEFLQIRGPIDVGSFCGHPSILGPYSVSLSVGNSLPLRYQMIFPHSPYMVVWYISDTST